MTLRFTLRAARQVEQALDRIAQESLEGAANVQRRVLALTIVLQRHPQAGRLTSRPGVRRPAVVPCPYLIDYRATNSDVVLRFRHTARKPL